MADLPDATSAVVFSSRSGWALQVPFLFFGLSAVCGFGAFAAVLDDANWKSLGGFLLALGLLAFSLSELRWMRARGGRLAVRTIYGTKTAPLDEMALGVRVHHGGRGGPTYTIYALTDEHQLDLGTALTRSGSERLRARLSSQLLGGNSCTPRAARNVDRVAAREAKQADATRQAQAVVDGYYSSGGARKATLLIVGILTIYLLGMGAYYWLLN